MEQMAKTYVCVKRFKGKSVSGELVNVPYGTVLDTVNDFILYKGHPLTIWRSQQSLDHFCQNDDGEGLKRGKIIHKIRKILDTPIQETEKQIKRRQAKWNKVWEDPICSKYRRPEHEDFWVWNVEFYHAPICDLTHILRLVGGG